MANENDNHSWRGQTYTLEHTVERSIKNWCRALVEAGDPLCPEIADLAQTVRLKLWQAGAEIDRIWSDADPVDGGFRGVCRYVSRVCTNALIDARRYAKVRKADQHDSLDEPVYSKAGEIQGTVADRISDEEGSWQAFQFADLRGGEFGLSDEEFTVLEGSVANGATQRELAQEIGTSDSTVSRTYIRAKDKAAKWFAWLKTRTAKQARAHIAPTFSRRTCLRPDRITPENSERWNDGLTIVPFHDEAAQWRPPITNQPRVRAKTECWNNACQNGLAIGSDNLVLPASRRNQAVRFLPALTGKNNRLCLGCKAIEQAARANIKIFKPTNRAAHFLAHQNSMEIR